MLKDKREENKKKESYSQNKNISEKSKLCQHVFWKVFPLRISIPALLPLS
jgi:hypothetical protein